MSKHCYNPQCPPEPTQYINRSFHLFPLFRFITLQNRCEQILKPNQTCIKSMLCSCRPHGVLVTGITLSETFTNRPVGTLQVLTGKVKKCCYTKQMRMFLIWLLYIEPTASKHFQASCKTFHLLDAQGQTFAYGPQFQVKDSKFSLDFHEMWYAQ